VFKSLLIANRGEIARRIIRTAKRLGVRTIAAYSDADADMPFVNEADDAVRIGPAPARESYLRGDLIIAAAKQVDAEAIHPGYGFLSENADFAEAVEAAGLIWIGAPPHAIRAMGLKDAAKKLMQDAGVPVTPGYLGEEQSAKRLKAEADAISYPVLIKAVAGGGGKGMRRVDAGKDFAAALEACKREAAGAFGDDRVLLEKYVESPRHIEVQVFGDRHGNVVHLFERDCSLQRRHQKVIEEAPAPGMGEETRAAICEAAVKAARAVNYVGAGTIEFIADAREGLKADRIWFMEMNTRLQVEHPVTEAITGVDLVEWQMRVAAGEALPKRQEDLHINGWAMEARLYAEDPASGFLPSIGRLAHLRLPSHLRVDSGVEAGNLIGPHYDPMIAKIVAHAGRREAVLARLGEACAEVEVWPVKTNAALLACVCADEDFAAGRIDTGLMARKLDVWLSDSKPDAHVLQAAARALIAQSRADPWDALTGFRVASEPDTRVDVEVGGGLHAVGLSDGPAKAHVSRIGEDMVVFRKGGAWLFTAPSVSYTARDADLGDGAVYAPMPGRILDVGVAIGTRVAAGQALLSLEAMKMEHSLAAPFAGTVVELRVAANAQVEEGVLLVRIEKDS